MAMSYSSMVGDDQRQQINTNFLASQRAARFRPYYFGAIVFTVVVAFAALFVDYMIVTEFWTRALSNEFLELPGTLAGSVAFKSLQVLFATLAAHIFIEHMSGFGRAVFVRALFILALTMLGGVGMLLALMSLPAGMADVGLGGPGASLGSALSSLGIETEAAREAVVAQTSLDQMRAYQPVFWMASLSVIFLVVTGVAALFLHYAVNNLRKIFETRDFVERKADMARLAALEAEYARNREQLIDMERTDYRRNALWTRLMDNCRAYERGLEGVRVQPAANRRTLTRTLALPAPGRRRRDAADADARNGQLQACADSQQIARYESVFEDWWSRRQRLSQNEGGQGSMAPPAQAGEVLPPLDGAKVFAFSKTIKAAE
ncbi:MAG: hypothetical protein JJ939_08525 [Alphaproteobacteria bacterium]|nr:hypothetical protein [Alphaproteobacteria bacterium]MBO6628451.1 hypothetical protein [Alphaproteobacteria bacterium]MDF1626114.1 hypothetical protein [Parvibaculaceae bacterium]